MSSFNSDGQIRTDNGAIISVFGKKRSGKTVLAMMLIKGFTGDTVVIDVAGDDGPQGPGVVDLRGTVDELPTRFPEHLREREGDRLIVRYCPDAGSPTVREDIDRVVGMAMAHSTKERPAMLVIHEIGVVGQVQQIQPHMRRVLMHNRHTGLVCVFSGPRVLTVDPLVYGQADLIYVFELPQKTDRERLADTIGWSRAGLDLDIEALGPHEYLRFDANEVKPPDGQPDYRLMSFPALPRPLVMDVLEWADRVPAPRQPAAPARQ